MQTSEIDPLELLALWWRAERQWIPVRGYPTECTYARGWRASRQYDDANGAAETDARGVLIRHIGNLVASIDEPHRTALYIAAKNRATGGDTWVSERLPLDDMERAEVVADAIEVFLSRL